MPKKQKCPPGPGGQSVRQGAVLQEILDALQSEDAGARAEAVRSLCPCRTAWDIPVQRYIAAMQDDPCSSVRHEVHHVLDEDSGWGRKLKSRRMHEEADAEDEEGLLPNEHSWAWRRRSRPRTKGAAARMAWSPRGRRPAS